MGKIIKREIKHTESIIVSTLDAKRCSRDCGFCQKISGLYECIRLNENYNIPNEPIEGFDGFEDVDGLGADGYGFKRTDSCIKDFGS